MAALPPDRHQPERDLGEPDDRKAQHPQQHPRADRAGGRLAHQPVAAPGVERQDDHQHELAEQAVDVQQSLVGGAAAQEGCAEQGSWIDVRERQPGGNRGVPEHVGSPSPERRPEREPERHDEHAAGPPSRGRERRTDHGRLQPPAGEGVGRLMPDGWCPGRSSTSGPGASGAGSSESSPGAPGRHGPL